MESILETKAATILEFLAGLRGTLSVTFEEGAWAAWLYDLLKPHVAKLVVCNPRKNALLKHGNKSDKIDARKLANLLRLNDLEPVYHGETGVRMLRELARSYLTIVKDVSRVMNRLKAISRSWAIPCAGRDVYYPPSQGVAKLQRPALAAKRATVSATGHAASPCASKPDANCWRRVASIPSLPNCGRFRPWGRFARLWRWLSSGPPRIVSAPSDNSGPTADWGWKPATAGNTTTCKAKCGAQKAS